MFASIGPWSDELQWSIEARPSLVIGGHLAVIGIAVVVAGLCAYIQAEVRRYARVVGHGWFRSPGQIVDHAHPVTMVVFWATWCRACSDELPTRRRIREEFVDVPMVSLAREEPTTLRRFMTEHPQVNTGMVQGYVEENHWWPPPMLPTILLLDAQGRIHNVMFGTGSYEQLKWALQNAVEGEAV